VHLAQLQAGRVKAQQITRDGSGTSAV
jgi:hypothetical protein